MRLGFLQPLYTREGPFASVYLDTSADLEDAKKAIELRWRSARERLEQQNADEQTLAAVSEELDNHQWRTGQRGQVIVACRGEVVFSDELPEPPRRYSDDEAVRFGPLPRMMPYLEMRAARIPYAVAVVDHLGAEITTVDASERSNTITVEGDDKPIHKNATGSRELNEMREQYAVEEQWKQNAVRVADELTRNALTVGAEVIVLAGDVQQRKLVTDALRKGLRERVVETEASHRERKASDESLRKEIDEAVQQRVRSRVQETVREFEQQRGERNRAVEGWEATVNALQRGQVATLLRATGVEQDEVSALRIGSGADQVALTEVGLTALGVHEGEIALDEPDSAVIRAAVGTDAELVLVEPDMVSLDQGIGAVLRYTDASTPQG